MFENCVPQTVRPKARESATIYFSQLQSKVTHFSFPQFWQFRAPWVIILSCQLLFQSTNLHKGKLNIPTNSPFKNQKNCLTESASWHDTQKKPQHNHCRVIRKCNHIPDLSLLLFPRQASTLLTFGACSCCHWSQRQTLYWLEPAQMHYYVIEQSYHKRGRIFLRRIDVHSWADALLQLFYKVSCRFS